MPKVIKGSVREIVLKVHSFCAEECERNEIIIPIKSINARVTAMTVRSLQLVALRKKIIKVHGIGACGSGSRQTGDCGHSDGDSDNPPRHLNPDCNPSAPKIYDCRKYGHNLPCDSVMPYFETLPYFPTGIFRCTAGEVLGLGANKCGCYKNPEYFSFHHMSFYDMHMLLRSYRNPSPKTGRKK